jgi:hypothetical protein
MRIWLELPAFTQDCRFRPVRVGNGSSRECVRLKLVPTWREAWRTKVNPGLLRTEIRRMLQGSVMEYRRHGRQRRSIRLASDWHWKAHSAVLLRNRTLDAVPNMDPSKSYSGLRLDDSRPVEQGICADIQVVEEPPFIGFRQVKVSRMEVLRKARFDGSSLPRVAPAPKVIPSSSGLSCHAP